jgi:hypothetical protein
VRNALEVERRVGLAHHAVEPRQLREHQPLELRHLAMRHRLARPEMRERAEHPADGVPEFPVGIDVGLQDFRTDAEILGIVGRNDPQAEDVGTGLLDDLLRRHDVAERLRHLSPVLGHDEAVRQHRIVRRAAARAAAFEERGMEPAAMLIGAFQIEIGRPL